jgi:hypothetical protein
MRTIKLSFRIKTDEFYDVDTLIDLIDDPYGPCIEEIDYLKVTDMSGRDVKLTNDIVLAVKKEIDKVDLYA